MKIVAIVFGPDDKHVEHRLSPSCSSILHRMHKERRTNKSLTSNRDNNSSIEEGIEFGTGNTDLISLINDEECTLFIFARRRNDVNSSLKEIKDEFVYACKLFYFQIVGIVFIIF